MSKPLFDITLGEFVDTSILEGKLSDGVGSATIMSLGQLPTGNGKYLVISKLMDQLKELSPGTLERKMAAVRLLLMMNYTVKWDIPEAEPVVIWFNTEGNHDQQSQLVQDILYRDYSTDPVVEEPNGKALFDALKHAHTEELGETIHIDSISDKS